jgi:WD40 repeat protein
MMTYIPRGVTYEVAPLAVAWNPRGEQLAVGLGGGIVHVVNAERGTLLATLTGPRDLVLDIAYSPDGTRIATANADRTAQVWAIQATAQQTEPLAATELLTLRGHAAGIARIAFNPDGTRLVTGDLDGVVRSWDATTGRALLGFPGLADRITGLAFDPKGAFLAASGDAVHLYLLRLDDLIALARSRVTRDLTPDECHQYLHVETDTCGAAVVQ